MPDGTPRKSYQIRTGMTRGRIIILAMALLVVALITLISIGLSYYNSISESIRAQQSQAILEQTGQTVTQRLDDVNNLLLLLQMPDFSLFVTNYMNLRDASVTGAEEKAMQDKFEALHLSPDVVDSVYMIGQNENQVSIRKVTGEHSLQILPVLRTDILSSIGLEELLMRNHDQFIRFHKQDFVEAQSRTGTGLLPDERNEVDSFLNSLDGRVVLATGTDKFFTVIVLSDQVFEQAFPDNLSGRMYLSVIRGDSTLLWSSAGQKSLRDSIAVGAAKSNTADGTYANISREIQPFGVHIVLSVLQPQSIVARSGLLLNISAVAAGTLLLAFLFGFFYLRLVFGPFHMISRRIGDGREISGLAPVFKRLPEKLAGSRFHSISLRNKLALLFCIALGILVSVNGYLLSGLLSGEIDRFVTDSSRVIGQCAAIGISDQIDFYEGLSNQISTSQQLQAYLVSNKINEYNGIEPLKMFPELNKISYVVLYSKSGDCIYSSVYSNNTKVFDIASMQIKNLDEPYWIYDYNDILAQTTVALCRKINVEGMDQAVWLLIVPKKEAFQAAQTAQVEAEYSIWNPAGNLFNSVRAASQPSAVAGVYDQKLSGGSGWSLSIRYSFSEIAGMKQAFHERFLLSIFIVFLVSVGLAGSISTMLTKPIDKLTQAMQAAESNGVAKPIEYGKGDEIGEIIHSYNRMIAKLEDATGENLRIMEENSRNKIRENELVAMKTQAEMNMLQAQINPHFLYNTLTTINMQSIRHGDDGTGRIVSALADLLRYSISTNSDTVTLGQEVKHALNYITIQQARFSDCFHASFDVPDDALGLPVLRFILQPVIENSIKHGFEGWQDGGEITVSARRRGTSLVIRVCDNGVGIDVETLAGLRAEMESELVNWHAGSIGLKNVYYRLKLKYHDQMNMEIHSELLSGTEVTIELPFAEPETSLDTE